MVLWCSSVTYLCLSGYLAILSRYTKRSEVKAMKYVYSVRAGLVEVSATHVSSSNSDINNAQLRNVARHEVD
jgi:hypothetical protein